MLINVQKIILLSAFFVLPGCIGDIKSSSSTPTKRTAQVHCTHNQSIINQKFNVTSGNVKLSNVCVSQAFVGINKGIIGAKAMPDTLIKIEFPKAHQKKLAIEYLEKRSANEPNFLPSSHTLDTYADELIKLKSFSIQFKAEYQLDDTSSTSKEWTTNKQENFYDLEFKTPKKIKDFSFVYVKANLLFNGVPIKKDYRPKSFYKQLAIEVTTL